MSVTLYPIFEVERHFHGLAGTGVGAGRPGRCRRGQARPDDVAARLDDVAARLAVQDATMGGLAVSGEQLPSLLLAAG